MSDAPAAHPGEPLGPRPTYEQRAWLSRPFVRGVLFLAVGGALHVGAALLDDAPAGPTIVVTGADVTALEIEYARQTGHAPDARTRRHLIDREVDDRLLVAEARRLGWHRTDPVVQRRLVQNQRFLETTARDEAQAPAGPGGDADMDDAALLERAYAQGMDRTDVVVKRRLLERMRLAVAEASRREPPTREALEAYRAAHPELFRRPARIDLVQVYLSRDRHGDALEARAREVAARLGEEAMPADEAVALGDPSLLPARVRGASRDELARRFGHDFADAAFAAEDGRFVGPIASSFGLHFVLVSGRTEARDPTLDEVAADVRARVEREREQAALLRLTGALRRRAVIRTPDDAADPGGDA